VSRIRIPFDMTVLILPEVDEDVTCTFCGKEWTCVRPIGDPESIRFAVCPSCKETGRAVLSRDAPRVIRINH
jgi:hypothetical protein